MNLKFNINLKNINFKSILQKFKAGKNSQKISDSSRDWKIIMTIFLVLDFAFLGMGLYFFWIENSNSILSSSQGQRLHTDSLDKRTLDKIITYFEAKKNNFDNLKLSQLNVKDPSI